MKKKKFQDRKKQKLSTSKENILRFQMCPNVIENIFSSRMYFSILTLIRAAGGVYDFRNFKEIYLCNGLSSNLQNSCIPLKMSREHILLNTLEQKTAFSASYRPKCARNHPLFRRFWLFRMAVKVYMISPPPPQGRALPPPIVGAPSSSGAAHAVSSSF